MTPPERLVAEPSVATARPANACLDIRDLEVHFPARNSFGQRRQGLVKAVDGVTLAVPDASTVALVGESGCGKSTLGRAIVGVHPPTAGAIHYRPRDGGWVDLAHATQPEKNRHRLAIRMIFQDPYTSLNPRQTVLEAIGQPLFAQGVGRAEVEQRVGQMMRKVGLRPEYMARYPHAFSGGERQRIVIARALVVRPHIVVADEAVSALDVSVRAQTLNLLQDLQDELGLTYLFVSHDLSVIKHIADQVAVMYVGRLVEVGPCEAIFAAPRHPYTSALLSAIPVPSPGRRRRTGRVRLKGEVADPMRPPPGCHFHPRCAYATERCEREVPPMVELGDGHRAACHHAAELSLPGLLPQGHAS